MPAVGKADVVVVDADGEITIVECKLAKNAEIRRWVIGQAFSYAAGLWRLGYEELKQAFAARDVDLAAPFANDPEKEAAFHDAVAENLTNGAFRLVIAVDAITDELKRTVVYINRHVVPELHLLALELRYAVDHGVEILLPEVYGVESAEHKQATPPVPPLDREKLLDLISDRRGPEAEQAAAAANAILVWAEGETRLNVRYTRTGGVIETADRGLTLLKLWPKVAIAKGLEVSLHTLRENGERWDDERVEQFVQNLADISVKLEGDPRWPRASLEPLADQTQRERFFELMAGALTALTA